MNQLLHIQDLIHKVEEKTVTQQELDELLQWIDSEEGLQHAFWVCEQLGMSTDIYQTEYKDANNKNYANALANRVLSADKILSITQRKRKLLVQAIHKKYWPKMAAAVAACAIIAFSLWIYVSRSKQSNLQQVAKTSTNTAILPGGNKAILTLSNGKKIVLDSVSNGLLAKQGNINVLKLSSGQIVYKEAIKNVIETVHYNTMSTPRGGQYSIALPDGTKVWLNAASSITYPTMFSGNTRVVSITGEAYFEVAKNPNKPFIVKTPRDMQVQVLGTHFNINAYTDESTIKTTLLEGAVKVTSPHGLQRLVPGEQAQLAESGNLKLLKDVAVEDVVGWKEGIFDFNNADISSVMRQLSRWYDVDIHYEGSNIPTDLFSGIIRRDNSIQQVLKMLETTLRVNFAIKGKSIFVSS
ncbi:MAG TPA: FecR family protein [Arachidicoccus soli]|nr:FecR family protein [Arachidicoccus soli]